LGMHYVQGRNGPPPPMIQHQQYMSPPRQMYPPGASRPNDVKLSNWMSAKLGIKGSILITLHSVNNLIIPISQSLSVEGG
uniref:Zinc finger protein n=1 Tax=Hymenolepis diminuta TaxID=6216 RepID=A0A0R3SNK9_HYMDI